MKSGIGKIARERPLRPGIADYCASDNGDGYLSDVQTHLSNNTSEVSQDFYSSAHLLEQNFKDKYNFIREVYDKRNRQLSSVVNKTCEGLISNDLLREMRNDATCSAFVPAHLGEVINRHLEDNREQFIHQLITQLSTTKLELQMSNEMVNRKSHSIKALEREVSSGKKTQFGVETLQRQLQEMRNQFEQLAYHSEEKIKKLQADNDQLNLNDEHMREQLGRYHNDLFLKSQLIESMRKNIDSETKNFSLSGISSDHAVDYEGKLQRSSAIGEVNELKSLLQSKGDELIRIQALLKSQTEDGEKSKIQLRTMMTQVESMLELEASESNKTIAAIHDKMKQQRTALFQEVKQERKLTSVLQEEIRSIRAEKEEISRGFRQATDDVIHLRDKLAFELQRTASLNVTLHQSQAAQSELRRLQLDAENHLAEKQKELSTLNSLKDEELKIEYAKGKMIAASELDNIRLSIDQQVFERTEEYKKSNERQLKALQNQMRHSYSYGSAPQHLTDNIAQSTVWQGVEANTALDMSLEVALRSADEKATVSKILLESEYLISKARSDAKTENLHREAVQGLQLKLREAAGNIEVLKLMVVKAKTTQDENTAMKNTISTLETENTKLKNKLKMTESHLRISDQKSKILENEFEIEKKSYRDLEVKFQNATQVPPELNNLQEMDLKIQADRRRNIEDRKKINYEIKKIREEKAALEEESRKIAAIKKIIIDGKMKSSEKWKLNELNASNNWKMVDKKSIAAAVAAGGGNTGSTAKVYRTEEEMSGMRTVLKTIEEEHSRDEGTVTVRGECVTNCFENNNKHNNKDNENDRDEYEDAHRQVQSLRALLTHTQEQALSDQRQDAIALQELNRKFDQLTLNYQANVAAIAHNAKEDASNVRNVRSEDLLIAQNFKIQSLEEDNSQKNMALSVLTRDLETVRADGVRFRERAEKLSRVLELTKEMFEKRFTELRVQIRKTRESVEDFDPYFDGECHRLVTVFGQTVRLFSMNQSVLHERGLEQLTTTLNNTHRSEVQSLRLVIVSLQMQIGKLKGDSHLTRSVIESIQHSEIDSAIDMKKLSDKDGEEEEKNSQGVAEGGDRRNMTDNEHVYVPRNHSDSSSLFKANTVVPAAATTGAVATVPVVAVYGSHDSLSNSLMSDSERAAFESVLRGVLESLETVSLLTQGEVSDILLLATQNEEPSFIAASRAKSLISDKLSTSSMEMKKLKNEIELLQRELKYEISEKIREKESKEP